MRGKFITPGYGYSAWFPWTTVDREGFNDKAEFSLSVDVPARWRTVAFGELRSGTIQNGRYCSSWQTTGRVPVYLAAIWAGSWTTAGDGDLTIYHLDSAESHEAAWALGEVAGPLRQALFHYYGQDKPRVRYFLVELDLPSGGYPSLGAVGLAKDGFRQVLDQDNRYAIFEWLGHEMVHEFVDLALDMEAPGAAAISDGFALYFHLPLLSELLGQDFEVWDLKRRWERYQRGRSGGRDAEGELPPEKPISWITLAEYGAYKDRFLISDKLQIVLTQLRRIVGHSAFMRGTAAFLTAHRDRPATMVEFHRSMEREAGVNLAPFFHRWLETTEELPYAWRYWE